MKILLAAVNAKYIHSNPAVYSLKAYACSREPELQNIVEIAEYTINHQITDILSDLYLQKPDVIGFSCYIWNITYILELAEEIKKLLPKVHIWLGGPEVSFDSTEVLRFRPFLSGVIRGEGEETFLELARYYTKASNKDTIEFIDGLQNINGIAYRREYLGSAYLRETQDRTVVTLSEIPFLYEDETPFENRIIYYESSRGCPFRCSYCLSSIDKTVRLRDIEIVKEELAFFIKKEVRQVKFVDRTFNCNKVHALAIWEYLLAHDNGVTNFHFEIAADLLDEELLGVLRRFRPGAIQLEIGVQSTNEETIREIDRCMDVAKLKKVVGYLHEGHNIHIHLDLIAGLPYEDYTSFGHSFDDVYAMKPEQLQLGFLKVLKGSKMQEKAKDYGLVYRSKPTYEVLYTNWLSYEEVCRLKQIEEMVETYYNSNQFTVTLPLAVARFSSPFAFFEALAQYYDRKGYFVKSPSRSYRYEILYEFLNKEPLFAETLTMDLYLRENCKTRPAFAPDFTAEKETIRAFFQREAQSHDVLGEAYTDHDARMLARAIHVEPVYFDYATGEALPEKEYIVFDYKERNPLTYEAATYKVTWHE